jgi:uncharacterized protein YbjT (DUF2867 family)
MTILVTGARGNIGRRVAALLTEAGHEVRGTTRDQLDITRPNLEALRDVDTMFLYPTRGNVDDFLAAARKVRHVVLLSSPAAYEPGEHDRPIGLAHRAMERAVERAGLSHTVLYPSWLATNAIRDWAPQLRTGRLAIAYPDARVCPIHLDDIAEVAADLLTRARHRGRTVVLTGPESLRLRDIVAVLAEVLERPVTVDTLTREEALAAPGLPESVREVLLDVMAAAVEVPATVNNNVERITGHPARTFREWAHANRDAF